VSVNWEDGYDIFGKSFCDFWIKSTVWFWRGSELFEEFWGISKKNYLDFLLDFEQIMRGKLSKLVSQKLV
jgi:hypothetical protein